MPTAYKTIIMYSKSTLLFSSILIIILFLFTNCISIIQFVSEDRVEETCCKNSDSDSTRTQKSIHDFVAKKGEKLKSIYEKALERNTNIQGKIKIRFAIKANGSVEYKHFTSCTINDSIFINDLIAEIKLWKFCPINSTIDVNVVYPLAFAEKTAIDQENNRVNQILRVE